MCRIIDVVQSPSADVAVDTGDGTSLLHNQIANKLRLHAETNEGDDALMPVPSRTLSTRTSSAGAWMSSAVLLDPTTTLADEIARDADDAAAIFTSSIDRLMPSRPSVAVCEKRGKCVRFADECGFALTDFRVMTELSEHPPNVPTKILFRHQKAAAEFAAKHNLQLDEMKRSEDDDDDEGYSSTECTSSSIALQSPPKKPSIDAAGFRWAPAFPHRRANTQLFQRTLIEQNIALQNVLLITSTNSQTSAKSTRLIGTIMVSNIAAEKRVFVRWTPNEWASEHDQQATYLSSSSAQHDTFRFDVAIPTPQTMCARVEFCVCMVAELEGSSGEFWDSNEGDNFSLIQTNC